MARIYRRVVFNGFPIVGQRICGRIFLGCGCIRNGGKGDRHHFLITLLCVCGIFILSPEAIYALPFARLLQRQCELSHTYIQTYIHTYIHTYMPLQAHYPHELFFA